MPNTSKYRTDDFTADRLRSLLHYNEDTGVFTWLVSIGHAVSAGDVAGTAHAEGYVVIGVDGHSYLAHRLAWLYMTGEWPKGKLDHKDRVRNHNWWSNIRLATNAQNSINSTRKDRDLPRGVYRHRKRFVALTTRRDLPKRSIRIGSFETAEAAHEAWLAYMIEHHGADYLPLEEL